MIQNRDIWPPPKGTPLSASGHDKHHHDPRHGWQFRRLSRHHRL